MDPDRFLILENLPRGVSPRQRMLQMSKARSHASTIGRQRALSERKALSTGPKHSEARSKPRIAWAGAYRIGPSPQHAREHVTKRPTNEDFQVVKSPLPSHLDLVPSAPKLPTIPGAPRLRNGKQPTSDQQPQSLEDDSLPDQGTSSRISKNTISTSGSSSPRTFQLVQYDPLRKTTPESIHAVRSNAVRYQWKRSKAVRPRGRKTKVPDTTDLQSKNATKSQRNRIMGMSESVENDTESRRQLIKLPAPGSDCSLQPGGYPTELPSGSVAPLYHLVYEVTNRTFVGNQARNMNVMAGRYVQQMRSHPASFHAAVWVCAKGIIDRTSTNAAVRKHTRLLDLCHNIAVKSVIQMISDLADPNYIAPPNALGMLCSAMQSLALGTTENVALRVVKSGPKQSTLTKLQNLDLFGIAPRWLNYHEEAARKILDTNPHQIDPFWSGLRICQTQNDIISSCRTLTKPRSPCSFLNLDFPALYNQVIFQLRPKDSPGFLTYAATLGPALSAPLLSTITQISSYSTIQAALLSNRLAWFGVECVCDARNWTQHQLMSLPLEGDLSMLTSIEDAALFSVVRNALIVYSFIAVFPLPLSTAPFPELASRLEAGILQVLEDDEDTESTALLLWISTMAALAAIGTPQRTSLVTLAAKFCLKLNISSWESMQAILQDYLWSEEISDFDGIFLFLEISKQMLEEDDNDSQWAEEE